MEFEVHDWHGVVLADRANKTRAVPHLRSRDVDVVTEYELKASRHGRRAVDAKDQEMELRGTVQGNFIVKSVAEHQFAGCDVSETTVDPGGFD